MQDQNAFARVFSWVMLSITAIILLLLILGAVAGCNCAMQNPTQDGPAVVDPTTPVGMAVEVARKANWLVWLSIPIISLGVVGIFNGATKLGFSAVVFGSMSLFMSMATAQYGKYMGMIGLIIGIVASAGAVAYSILVKNKALTQIVNAVQEIRKSESVPDTVSMVVDSILDKHEDESTKTLVKKVKGDV
jgi:hypothetical protein